MAKIDIAIPCYQYGRYLTECVESVLAQDVQDLRVLIIDNASTDNSVEVAKEFARKDRRVEIVVHQKNLGPHASCNEGIDWASSDYFLLLDADDLLHEGALARATRFLDAHGDVAMTYGRASYLTSDGALHQGNQVDPRIGWEIIDGTDLIWSFCAHPVHMIPSPTVVRRTAAQKKAGYYRTTLPYTDDMEMWLRLMTLGHVGRTGHAQSIQRFHETRHTNQYLETVIRDFSEREKAIESFFAHEGKNVPGAADMLARARHSLGCHAYWTGLSQTLKGKLDLTDSRDLFSFAYARSPSAFLFPPLLWLLKHKLPHTSQKRGFGGA